MADRWLSLEEAAQRVDRSERTIRRWVERNLLRQFPDGRVLESHVLATDVKVRSNKGGRPAQATTIPLMLDGAQVGRLTIATDGTVTGRIATHLKP